MLYLAMLQKVVNDKAHSKKEILNNIYMYNSKERERERPPRANPPTSQLQNAAQKARKRKKNEVLIFLFSLVREQTPHFAPLQQTNLIVPTRSYIYEKSAFLFTSVQFFFFFIRSISFHFSLYPAHNVRYRSRRRRRSLRAFSYI